MPHDVIMPALGMSQESGKIVSWLKKEGDAIVEGDPLFEVETDKTTIEVPASANGYLASVTAKPDQDVPVGQVIARIVDTIDQVGSPDVDHGAARLGSTAPAKDDIPAEPEISPARFPAAIKDAPPVTTGGKILASPKTKRLARESGLDLALLVERGLSQPYHVADLQMLSASPPVEEAPSLPSLGTAVQTLHISAKVPAAGCDDFVAWLNRDGGIVVDPKLIWLRLAAVAFRSAAGIGRNAMIIETITSSSESVRFVDPDFTRLSQPARDTSAALPSLILRDLTATRLLEVRLTAKTAPVLSIGRDGQSFHVGLDFTTRQLSEEAAIQLATDFVESLSEPLGHVV